MGGINDKDKLAKNKTNHKAHVEVRLSISKIGEQDGK